MKANGQYKPNAPDFSSVDKFDTRGNGEASNVPIWIEKDGVINEDEAKLLTEAGVDLSLPNSPQDLANAGATPIAAAQSAVAETKVF